MFSTRFEPMQRAEPAIPNNSAAFCDAIAAHYHLYFRDWRAITQREGSTLRRLFRARNVTRVLDTSFTVGTQSIGLAMNRFQVTYAVPGEAMLEKAREAAKVNKVADRISFVKASVDEVAGVVSAPVDAVVCKGSTLLTLLDDDAIVAALRRFYDLMRPGGMIVIGTRDFDLLLEDRARFVPRQTHLDDPRRDVILFDIYDWNDGPPVTVTASMFVVSGKGDQYAALRSPITYRALSRAELEGLMQRAGFTELHMETDVLELVITGVKPG